MSSVCFPISFLHVQSGCGMEVGVKHFYGQEMKARMASKKPTKAAVQSGGAAEGTSETCWTMRHFLQSVFLQLSC